VLSSLLWPFQSQASPPFKRVFINQIVTHPALESTVKGIVEGLKQKGFEKGVNLDFRVESAQGSSSLSSQISTKFVNQDPDVVVGVGTTSAQSFLKFALKGDVNLIYSSVTDPQGAGLVPKKPAISISGVSNFVALEPQLELFKKVQPQLKRLGIIYNPGELNSVSIVKKLDDLCSKYDLKLVKQAVSKTADVPQATTKISQQVDAIFISNDNTALSALESVIGAANKAKIPVYVSDTDAVELGALAALGPNQYQIGVQTGQMIARVLNGEDVKTLPLEYPKKMDLYINLSAARSLGIVVPDEVITQSQKIVDKKKS
jgi:putative ABC transport system substrate-binding protein